MSHVSTEQLLQMIGGKQVAIENLIAENQVLMRALQEARARIAELEAQEEVSADDSPSTAEEDSDG